MTAAQRRSHKTINRDLSTMATVAKHLATTSWKPRMPGATVMDFGAGRIAIKSDPDIDTRPPWTTVPQRRFGLSAQARGLDKWIAAG